MATAVRAACRLQPFLKNIVAVQQQKAPAITKTCHYYSCRRFSLYKSLLADRRYTQEHEWVLREGTTSNVTVGITDYAQDQLGDVVFVELPEVGNHYQQADEVGSIESVKAVSEVYSPLAGKILEVNKLVEDSPEMLNQDPLGDGWLFKLAADDISAVDSLMTEKEYDDFIHGL